MPAAICPGTKRLRTGTCGPYTWFLAQEVGHMSAKKTVLIKQKSGSNFLKPFVSFDVNIIFELTFFLM